MTPWEQTWNRLADIAHARAHGLRMPVDARDRGEAWKVLPSVMKDAWWTRREIADAIGKHVESVWEYTRRNKHMFEDIGRRSGAHKLRLRVQFREHVKV